MLDELTSKNLQHTLDKLMTDSDRRQSMVQELISSSHRIQLVLLEVVVLLILITLFNK